MVLQTRNRALEQLPGRGASLASIDVSNTAGPGARSFADVNVGYVVAEFMVRQLAPLALERVGERAFAARLRALEPIHSRETAWRAEDVAEDIANTIARRHGRVRWTQPWGAAVEVTVEAAAVSGYVATPGSVDMTLYVMTIASGFGATERVGLPQPVVEQIARRMLDAMIAASHCP